MAGGSGDLRLDGMIGLIKKKKRGQVKGKSLRKHLDLFK